MNSVLGHDSALVGLYWAGNNQAIYDTVLTLKENALLPESIHIQVV